VDSPAELRPKKNDIVREKTKGKKPQLKQPRKKAQKDTQSGDKQKKTSHNARYAKTPLWAFFIVHRDVST